MTPEFGAASQLEKIDMLDFADVVAINKYERRGAEDARRDVARQLVRNRGAFGAPWEDMPVFGTSAARFDDDGVTALYQHLRDLLAEHGLPSSEPLLPPVTVRTSTRLTSVLPPAAAHYLAEVAETVRGYHAGTERQAAQARRRQQLRAARRAARGRRRHDAAASVAHSATPRTPRSTPTPASCSTAGRRSRELLAATSTSTSSAARRSTRR